MTAASLALLFALLALGAIPLLLLAVLLPIRVRSMNRGEVAFSDMALSRDPWPEREKKVSNAVDNQFQLPLLFAAGAGLALYLDPTSFEVLLAWVFVASRVVHAAIFVTTNYVPHRFGAYAVGYILLIVFWLDLLARLVLLALGNG